MKKVVYLLDIFPTVSETFILNEILAVTEKNIDVAIFSRRAPQERSFHPRAGRLRLKTRYLTDPSQLSRSVLLRSHLSLFLRYPVSYLKTLIFALRHRRDLGWYFKAAGCYALQIARERPDHIHSHFASLANGFAMLVSMILRVPYTFTAHGWHDIFHNPPADFYHRAAAAKKVITVSRYNKNYLSEHFAIPETKIEVVHCGIKTEMFSSSKKSSGPVQILSVSRLHPIKGVEHLIRACRILKDRGFAFHCTIVGDGEQYAEMNDLIRSLQLEGDVELAGAKTEEEVRRYYSAAHIYVNSSLCEGLSVSIMEAMASGLPVVASEVTGVGELIEPGVNGRLVPPGEPEPLADAVMALGQALSQFREMGVRNSAKIRQDFYLDTEVEKLVNIWSDQESRSSWI